MRNGSGGAGRRVDTQQNRSSANCTIVDGVRHLCVIAAPPSARNPCPKDWMFPGWGRGRGWDWEGPGIPHPITISCALMKPATRHGTGDREEGRRDTMLMASALLLLMLPLPSLDLRGGLFISSNSNSLPLSNSDADDSNYTAYRVLHVLGLCACGVIGCRVKKFLALFRMSRYSL